MNEEIYNELAEIAVERMLGDRLSPIGFDETPPNAVDNGFLPIVEYDQFDDEQWDGFPFGDAANQTF